MIFSFINFFLLKRSLNTSKIENNQNDTKLTAKTIRLNVPADFVLITA